MLLIMPAHIFEVTPYDEKEFIDIIHPNHMLFINGAALEDSDEPQPVTIMCDGTDAFTAIYATEEALDYMTELGDKVNFSLIGKIAVAYHANVMRLPFDVETGDRHALLIEHQNLLFRN